MYDGAGAAGADRIVGLCGGVMTTGDDDGLGPSGPGARPRPGDILFGRYRVERLLGGGGMGNVWLVRHLGLDAPRALKLVVSGVAFQPEAQARFRREARAMARLSHPNAVTVHDFQAADGSAFIEMECVHGRSLDRVTEPGVPMPVGWVGRILGQLCDVLQQAHDHQIVHRDLKPSNVMLLDGHPPGREQIKVLDFGIAKILEPEATASDADTSAGSFLGTVSYASPEQAVGGPIDGRSDLYSVGVMLYEFLTGHRPFEGPTVRQLYDHSFTPAPAFSERNPDLDVPPELEALVLRCLAKKPADRPPTARTLAEEFARAAGTDRRSPGPMPPGATRDTLRISAAPEPPRTSPDPGRTVSAHGSHPFTALDTLSGHETLDDARVAFPGVDLAQALGPETLARPRTDPGGETVSGGAAEPPSPPRRPGRRTLGAAGLLLLALAVVAAVVGRPPRRRVVPSPNPVLAPVPVPAPTSPAGYVAVDPSDAAPDGAPRVLVRGDAGGPEFLRIAGGEFLMGDPDANEARPAHRVVLSGFYLQKTEVTNGEMEAYFRARRVAPEARPPRWREAVEVLKTQAREWEKHPALGVSRATAEDFARWAAAALPTEAQWEYAARSGGKPYPHVWGDGPGPSGSEVNLNTVGSFDVPTSPVGSHAKDRTEQGVVDMAGNVREWCRDVWAFYQSTSKPTRDPTGPPPRSGPATQFVVRGGSFRTYADKIFTTRPRRPNFDVDGADTAEELAQDGTAADLGFRLVIEWPPAHGTDRASGPVRP